VRRNRFGGSGSFFSDPGMAPGTDLKSKAMKNLFRLMTVAAVLAGGFTFAADDKPATDAAPAKKVEAAAKKEAPVLTPEEREKRRKEMAAKRAAKLKELNEKKPAGTLTEKEKLQLERLEKGGRPGGSERRSNAPKKDTAPK
jgi:hypothetical protein